MLTYYLSQLNSFNYRYTLPLMQLDITPQMGWFIVQKYGAIGILILVAIASGRGLWIWFTLRQKRYDDLNDTMVSSLKLKDTELANKLGDIVERLTVLETESRNHSKSLSSLDVELTRSFTMVVALARVIPIKEERRRTMNETEIKNLIRAIKEEFNL